MADDKINITKPDIAENNLFVKLSPFMVLLCAVLLGIEVSFHYDKNIQYLFSLIDYLFLGYFSIEIGLRFYYNKFSFKEFLKAINKIIEIKKDNSVKNKLDAGEYANLKIVAETWVWLLFDFTIVFLSIISLYSHFTDHPEAVAIFRLFRVFRVLRIFEISSTLQKIEQKIFSVIPTVFVFAVLLFMIIYVYAIIGMYLYGFKKYDTINFSSLYETITGLFIIISNGWSDVLFDLKQNATNISPIVSDFYVISFIIFSVIVTLNVFIAVMTSQIQDKLEDGMSEITEKEDKIILDTQNNLEKMMKSFNEIKKELAEMEEKINEINSKKQQ
jgi:voltage-gated sodium channel